MSSIPSVSSPQNTESPTFPESEVGCCCRTATSDFPPDPPRTAHQVPRSHLQIQSNNRKHPLHSYTRVLFVLFVGECVFVVESSCGFLAIFKANLDVIV